MCNLSVTKRHVGDSPNIWRKGLLTDENKIELFGHQGKCYVWHKPNTSSPLEPHQPENLLTLRTPSPQWSMVVAASCCGGAFHWQRLGNWSKLKEWWTALNTGTFLRETSSSLPEVWDRHGGSPSGRTMTLSILLKQHSSGIRGNI